MLYASNINTRYKIPYRIHRHLRGLIMLIMALDHTRDFFHLNSPNPTDLTPTTLILFFTRWTTHFCAPLFAVANSFLVGNGIIVDNKRDKINFY